MFSERPESLPAFVVFILYILIYGVPRGTLFSVDFAEKSYKSFQIFQIFFYHYLFVRFVPICKIYSPIGSSTRLCRRTLLSSRLRREILQIFPNPPIFIIIKLRLKINVLLVIGGIVTAFSGRLPCRFLSVPDYVVQDG